MRRPSVWMVSFVLLVLLGLSGLATAAARPPLFFEANQGQTDPEVRFLARSGGYTLLLTPTEAVLALKGPAAVRMKLAGDANAAPEIVGEDPLTGKVNYLRGSDPGRWHKAVPTYGRVRYRAVYPGIDLVFYRKGGGLEYDFIVAPGADPTAIKLAFSGVDHTVIDERGDLVLRTAGEPLRLQKPIIYQMNGDRPHIVDGSYVQVSSHEVGFHVGAYDRTRALIIDPVLSYSTYLGGSGFDEPSGLAVDATGAAFVTGNTTSTDFPTANALQPALQRRRHEVGKLQRARRDLGALV